VVTRTDAQRKASAGSFVAIAGRLSAASATQLQGLRRIVEQRVADARLDLSAVISFDDPGARLLADLLAQARKARLALTIERPEKLRMALEPMLRKGRDGGQGAWLLTLELMQWQHEQAGFEDRAVDFAVAFEVSPPSWEPPPRLETVPEVDPGAASAASGKVHGDRETVVWQGAMVGSSVPQIKQLADHAHGRHLVSVDMSGVERVDFVSAGALLNAIGRIESERKTVQFMGASPMVRALLLLIGISPRHFVKKAV
jgi:anti-anti-sigma regulatory factor